LSQNPPKIYRAKAPSNIALIKYWGKRDAAKQWPANDSLSMTLSGCLSTTTVRVTDSAEHTFSFEGGTLCPNTQKPLRHLERLAREFGFTQKLGVNTSNSFPTGTGIASSASGLSALTLAALAAWSESASMAELTEKFGIQRLATFSRLGSGSACRSLQGGFVKWLAGKSPDEQSVEQIASADHWKLHDVIVIFSDQPKQVGSTEAHDWAWDSPLFELRLAGLAEKTRLAQKAIEERDLKTLGPIIEAEALEMHSVMMTSDQPVNYLTEKSVRFMSWLRKLRFRESLEAYFTLDAGPNVHLLCEPETLPFLQHRLQRDWGQTMVIIDQIGRGPVIDTIQEVSEVAN
jgi:diphosphomevalonate decarboxylase